MDEIVHPQNADQLINEVTAMSELFNGIKIGDKVLYYQEVGLSLGWNDIVHFGTYRISVKVVHVTKKRFSVEFPEIESSPTAVFKKKDGQYAIKPIAFIPQRVLPFEAGNEDVAYRLALARLNDAALLTKFLVKNDNMLSRYKLNRDTLKDASKVAQALYYILPFYQEKEE